MMWITIWERYFLKELAKGFFLFLGAFWFLYVLIDYSSHAKAFSQSQIPLQEAAIFYGCMFVRRIDLVVPFGLLLATMRTLISLNLNNELVAMLAGGISIKRLTRPFLLTGLFCTALMYLSEEFLLPPSQLTFRTLEDQYLKKGQHKRRLQEQEFYDLILQDGSTLLYQSFNTVEGRFFDVSWVKSIDEIYRIKFLYLKGESFEGHFVDRISRDPQGGLELQESWEQRSFPEISMDAETLNQVITGPKDQSLSKLWQQVSQAHSPLSDHQAAVATYLHYKLAIPWLCLLVVLGPTPFCVQYSRNLPTFFIYALSIIGLVTFYLIMDTTIILGKHQVVPPFLSAWAPLGSFFVPLSWRFFQMR